MRADLGPAASADHLRLVDAVVARVPAEVELEPEKPVSAWVLVAANLVPLAGVLWWDWSVFALLVLFWMENVVIGLLFALRLRAEERMMCETFPGEYEVYAARTKRLIPGVW